MTTASLTSATEAADSPVVLDGLLHPDFAEVAELLEQQLAGYAGGGAACVYHRGECVVDLWGGRSDREGRAWTRDTLAPSFSTTKGVAATLLHMLVDRGLLDYEDRVASHWPEFGQAGKSEISVRHVLSHQSGLYHVRQMIDRADRLLDWPHMIRALERARPAHAPGARTGYHGLTFGFLVGELAQRVTGRRFPELVASEIAAPLGLDGFYVGAPEEALPRVAELIWPERFAAGMPARPLIGRALRGLGSGLLGASDGLHLLSRLVGLEVDVRSLVDAVAPRGITGFDFGSPEAVRAAIPSANGVFTARSLAKLYAALAAGGQLGGVRLLSAETLARATEIQTPGKRRAVLPFDLRWRLGYHLIGTSRGILPEGFGHFGIGGSGAWADPSRDLSVAMIVNSGIGTPFGDLRMVRVGGAAVAGADRRDGRPALRRLCPFL